MGEIVQPACFARTASAPSDAEHLMQQAIGHAARRELALLRWSIDMRMRRLERALYLLAAVAAGALGSVAVHFVYICI